ncbi:MAG: ATP-binding protein [Candidatus Sericytochromatia bacterium]
MSLKMSQLWVWVALVCLWVSPMWAQALPQPPLALSAQDVQKTIALNTTWDFTGPDGRRFKARVPDKWEALYKRRLPVYGMGVYTLRLTLPPELRGRDLMLYSDDISGDSFRAYVNGQLVGHNGFYVGSASRVAQFQPFRFEQNPLEIKVVVNNQLLQWSGLLHPVWIGLAPEIDKRIHRTSLLINLIFGIFAFLAFFHLLLYAFHPQDKAIMWFGLLCLFTCVFMEFYRVHNLEYFFGDIPLIFSSRLLRLGLYGLLPCFFWYARALSKDYVSLRFAQGVSWLHLGFGLTLFLPGRIQNPLLNLWLLVMGLSVVYNTWLLRKHVRNSSVTPFVYSGLIYAATVVNDILNAFSVIHTGYFTRYGFLTFCLSQSGFLAWRLQKNYLQSLHLTQELATINHNLEDLVDVRTQEVNQKNEELNQLLTFKEEMVEMLVHDLKTPLNVLLNLPQHSGAASESSSVQAASLRMKTLIESLLNVKQNDQAALELQLSTQRIGDLVQRVSTLLQPWALSKGIQIATLVHSEEWLQLDAFLFERVIQNILDNAIKHAPFGSEIHISSHHEAEYLALEIRDAGPGMTPEIKQKARAKYQSFAQANAAQSSGLGLYFCQRVVEAHQGELLLLDAPEGGTLVRLLLPRLSAPPAPRLQWTPDQLATLAPYVQPLAEAEVYKISELKPLLKEMSDLNDPQIRRWLEALKRAIKEVNETSYRELIDQITPGADCRR